MAAEAASDIYLLVITNALKDFVRIYETIMGHPLPNTLKLLYVSKIKKRLFFNDSRAFGFNSFDWHRTWRRLKGWSRLNGINIQINYGDCCSCCCG